jgi:ABC-type enterobactin transport system permease subunit
MNRLRAVLVAVLVGAALTISAQPAAADTGSITIYRDHNQVGSMYTWAITGGCGNGRQIVAYVLTYERQRASSIRFLAGGMGNNECNYLSVRSGISGHPYWGTCVQSFANGYNFGWPYNDNTDAWVLEHRAGCHNYY